MQRYGQQRRQMVENTVSNHFIAAVGVEKQMEKVAEAELQAFYATILVQYRRETQNERARQLLKRPLDYTRVRALDRELQDIIWKLCELDMERFNK